MIYQDTFSSLSPRMTVEKIISEPMVIHTRMTRKDRRERVFELLQIVGLKKNSIDLYSTVKSLYLQNRAQRILNADTTIDTQDESDWEEIETE